MATAVKLQAAEASTSIALVVEQTPEIVLVDDGKREQLYEHIQREVDAFEPDLSTVKGRDAIKSLAFKITRTKTAIDAAGKKLNEDARARINIIDAARRDAREKLDALAKSVRQPLTDWEVAEDERINSCRADIAAFKAAAVVTLDDSAASVRERGKEVWGQEIDPERFGDILPEAQAAKDAAVAALKAALDRLTREENERAELERLRQEAAEREAREMAEREAREAEERAVAEAKAEEERRLAAEKAEAERIERARAEAAEAARRQAEEDARREREEAEAAKQAEVDAANERAARAEAEAQAERAARAERDRLAKEAEEAAAAEQKRRDEDRAHRGQVMGAAKTAIMTCGTDEETAKKIVLAIIAGEVPAVTLRF